MVRVDDNRADVPVSDRADSCCRRVGLTRCCRDKLVESSAGWEMDVFNTGAMVTLAVLLRKAWQESMTMGLMCQCQIALIVVVRKLSWPGGAMMSWLRAPLDGGWMYSIQVLL